MLNIKENLNKAAYKACTVIDGAANEINENPYLIYCGLLGLSFAIGILHADTKADLQEIKNKLD